MSARSTFADRAPVVVVLSLALFALLAPAAASACDAVIVPTSSTLRLDYDPFAFARTIGRLTFEIESRESAACDADIVLLDTTLATVGDKDIGGTGVVVTFSPGAGDATLTQTAAAGVWRVRIDPGRRIRLSIEGIVTQDAVATAGEHDTDLTLELRDVGAVAARRAGIPVSIVLASLPRAQMNIVGAVGTFGQGEKIAQIDFGELASDATRRVFLQVRANTTSRLTIDSANFGRLLRPDSPAQEAGIAYAAMVGGYPVDLARHWERRVDPTSSIAGTSLPLDLTLSDVGAHAAGTYSDLLTIELSAI